LKITGILKNEFETQKTLENRNKIIQYTGPPSFDMVAKLGLLTLILLTWRIG
jgi:hypothetical protein